MFRRLAECLPFLWAVDAVQPDTLGLSIVEYVNGVAVDDADDGAAEVG